MLRQHTLFNLDFSSNFSHFHTFMAILVVEVLQFTAVKWLHTVTSQEQEIIVTVKLLYLQIQFNSVLCVEC